MRKKITGLYLILLVPFFLVLIQIFISRFEKESIWLFMIWGLIISMPLMFAIQSNRCTDKQFNYIKMHVIGYSSFVLILIFFLPLGLSIGFSVLSYYYILLILIVPAQIFIYKIIKAESLIKNHSFVEEEEGVPSNLKVFKLEKNVKKEILQKLSANKINEALSILRNYSSDTTSENFLIMLESKYKLINTNSIKGIITEDQKNANLSKLTNNILKLINS